MGNRIILLFFAAAALFLVFFVSSALLLKHRARSGKSVRAVVWILLFLFCVIPLFLPRRFVSLRLFTDCREDLRVEVYERGGEGGLLTGFTLPTGVTAQARYTYAAYNDPNFDTPLTTDEEVCHCGTYRIRCAVVITCNGTNYTIWSSEGEDHFLRITRRSVTLTSVSDEKAYDGTVLMHSDPDADIILSGDGFVDGEGVDITFSVDAFRRNIGTSENAFEYTFWENTHVGDYTITKVFGTLTVT